MKKNFEYCWLGGMHLITHKQKTMFYDFCFDMWKDTQ